ncbi:MAG: aldehyde dehydrogenase family protein [Saprospiraceae bacterium]
MSKFQDSNILNDVRAKYDALRKFHDSGKTRSYGFRLESLLKLKKAILHHSDKIEEAITLDFNKPKYETYLSDIGVITDELNHAIKNLKSWMKPKKVSTSMAIFPGYISRLHPESKGVVVIFAPWNYPVNLALIPLIGSVAAGNTVLVKPAHETSHSAQIVADIIQSAFSSEHVTTILGEGSSLGPLILDNFRFDHIFFTGSQSVGKYIMTKAAENLTPVTLELGGKSPAIIDASCHLSNSVNRLVWGKFFNAGQTCIAPDYLLIHNDIYEKAIPAIIQRIRAVYGENPKNLSHFAKLINKTRTLKVVSYISQGEVLYGGNYDLEERYVEPTLILVKDTNLPIMSEEIFGPVWPILTWKTEDDLLQIIRKNRYPLSCYIYSNSQRLKEFIIQNIEFGSGCINDNMVQFANKSIPFGGVQYSGFGRYHGKSSFETFSNTKGIVTSLSWFDHPLKYPPYVNWKKKVSSFFLK